LKEIYDRIRAEDPLAKRAGEFSGEMRERSPVVSLLGFVRYHEWIRETR